MFAFLERTIMGNCLERANLETMVVCRCTIISEILI
jgi:hypothetical protein